MPTQAQVQQSILSAQLIAANKTEANRIALVGGSLSAQWGYIYRIQRFINAVLRQYNLGDYSSANFLIAYDCLLNLIGIDTTVNTIDPNFQNPAFDIGYINPASYAAPLDVPFASFDAASQSIDGGRTIYYNANWKGLNPQLALTSPSMTALYYGVDYILISTGGIQLLPGGNLPEIYTGQIIRSTGYDLS